ncbi:12369_t:CDS:2, partial [Cetraspora pellucida]
MLNHMKAGIYGESASTVQSIVNTFDKEDRIVPKPRGGDKRSILNEQHKMFLEDAIEEEPWISISDLTQKLPAICKVVNNREKNISVIAAINKNGVLHYKSILGSVNAEIYATFIYELINIIPNSKFLAINNISFYRSDVVKETVANTIHQFLYLLLCSLFLNPIENCFSKLKDSVARNHLRDRETILSRMNDGFNIVTEEDCIGWIRHISSYFDHCLN